MKPLINVEEYFGHLTGGKFKERLNRFTVKVRVERKELLAHLADTGRLREILIPNSPVVLAHNKKGKLDYKLVGIKSSEEWIFLYTPLHSEIAIKLIKMGILGFFPEKIKKEVKVGNSKIDLLVNDKIYIEVKGCNLKIDDTCLFPDAPTKRGRKHLEKLISLKNKKYEAAVLFLLLRNCSNFKPNSKTDPEFSNLFAKAIKNGVRIYLSKIIFNPPLLYHKNTSHI